MHLTPDEYVRNNHQLQKLKDIHRGRRAVVVGNGPSLNISDLDRLASEICFASNRIFLAFDQTPWRPTYYTMCDAVVARSNRAQVLALELNKVLGASVREYFQEDPRAVFVNYPRLEDEQDIWTDPQGIRRMKTYEPALTAAPAQEVEAVINDTSWPVSWNLLRGARAGHSVVNLGLKVAYWMGIREVYVIGCDHSFVVPPTPTGEIVYQNQVIISQGERNHFHPDYRKPGDPWTTPQLDTMTEEFAYARKVFESDNGQIYNASRTTQLEVWDKVNFDEVFPG